MYYQYLSSFEKDILNVFEPTIYLKNGDNLNAYGVDAKIIELPRYTNGSIGLEIEGDKLFVGDKTIYFGHGMPKRNRKWIKLTQD